MKFNRRKKILHVNKILKTNFDYDMDIYINAKEGVQLTSYTTSKHDKKCIIQDFLLYFIGAQSLEF